MKEISLKVQKFNPSTDRAPKFVEFKVQPKEGMTVLDAILRIRDYEDHSIAARFSCRMASCGSCGMKINGRPRLACYTQLSELGTDTVTVQPLDNFPIVRDLVTDLEGFFHKHSEVLPHMIRQDQSELDNPTGDFVMSPKDLEAILQFTYCIKCGLCTSSCPTSATDSLYLGPQALAQAYRYQMDVRDEGGEERLKVLDTEHGIWRCHYAGSCSAVCPKGVDPALGIQLLKRHVMAARPPRKKGEGAKLSIQKK
ncbi:MAG: succinate dehydrogenase iron-sulfur subunit [Nitrososphaerota archaeon]|nr:succinate dehydrogenase iron-sulfur subunit [Nitrososphaerota archaeon]